MTEEPYVRLLEGSDYKPVASHIGRRVASVDRKPFTRCESRENDAITLTFADGATLCLDLYGDCCSVSYFTDDAVKEAQSLIGATIQRIEDRDSDKVTGCTDQCGDDGTSKWHFLVFVTDKGHVTLDWRNDSNGYYDGTVVGTFMAAKEAR